MERFVADLESAAPNVREKIGGAGLEPSLDPTPRGVMKINVDATLSKIFCIATVAAIARDKACTFLGAFVIVMETG